ncbi:MAG: carboxymuconolactone decarboxylase family protein [Pseudomonadales bacterium]|nr:carboxymuconolactone decarboxylase family protein [Pseudomonadales bacterium]
MKSHIKGLQIFSMLLVTVAVFTSDSDAQTTQYQPQGMQTADKIPADILPETMARLPQVQRDEMDATGQAAYDTYVRPGTGYESGPRGPVAMWLHSPVLAEAIFDVRQRVRYGTEKDQRLTELIILSTAREINHQYEWSAHEPLAITAGLEQDIIEVIKYRKDLNSLPAIAGLGETEKLLIQFTRELVSEEKVSSDTFSEAIEMFGNEGLMDIVGLVGYYNFVAMTLKAFDVQRPVGTELLLPLAE